MRANPAHPTTTANTAATPTNEISLVGKNIENTATTATSEILTINEISLDDKTTQTSASNAKKPTKISASTKSLAITKPTATATNTATSEIRQTSASNAKKLTAKKSENPTTNTAKIDFSPLLESTRELARILAPHTSRAYIVGGALRDYMLRGTISRDIDIELYDISQSALDELMGRLGAQSVGKSFFVYKLSLAGRDFDIALARYESKVARGHRGFAVRVCDDEREGSRRRDFTINAMMLGIFDGRFLDFWGGADDLWARRLCVVDERRFGDDSLRVLRGVQFAARLKLSIDARTMAVLGRMELGDLSRSRINAELDKLFDSARPELGLYYLYKLGLLGLCFGLDDDFCGSFDELSGGFSDGFCNSVTLPTNEISRKREFARMIYKCMHAVKSTVRYRDNTNTATAATTATSEIRTTNEISFDSVQAVPSTPTTTTAPTNEIYAKDQNFACCAKSLAITKTTKISANTKLLAITQATKPAEKPITNTTAKPAEKPTKKPAATGKAKHCMPRRAAIAYHLARICGARLDGLGATLRKYAAQPPPTHDERELLRIALGMELRDFVGLDARSERIAREYGVYDARLGLGVDLGALRGRADFAALKATIIERRIDDIIAAHSKHEQT